MPVTYKEAGVDIDAGEQLVDRIKPLAHQVQTPYVIGGIGGFAGLCRLPSGLRDPVLVSAADGVGTKLELAAQLGRHDTIGVDLVAMCVNDVITAGARPLFFLNCFTTGHLDVQVAESVVRGIAQGCRQAGCALLGGESAELPGMYASGRYDLTGFAVGAIERRKLVDGKSIQPGDLVIALASSGVHANGFSLVRHIVQERLDNDYECEVEGIGPIGKALLVPTRIYIDALTRLLDELGENVRGVCHITGGGLVGNLPRILPPGLGADLDLQTFERPRLFTWFAQTGPVVESELLRTFNVGVGMCVIVAPQALQPALELLREKNESAWPFGRIVATNGEVRVRIH